MSVATFQMFAHCYYHFIMFTRNFVSESKSNNDGWPLLFLVTFRYLTSIIFILTPYFMYIYLNIRDEIGFA